MSKSKLFNVMAGIVALALILSACGGATPTAAPTAVPPTAVPPSAVPPTAVPPTAVPPTEVPFGSPDKPIIMALAPSATSDELIASGNTIADLLSADSGLTIKAVVPTY